MKLPISTPLAKIFVETGILPRNLECENHQLIYLWTLLNKKDQSYDIANMQPWPTKIHSHICHILKTKIKRPVFRKLSVMNL